MGKKRQRQQARQLESQGNVVPETAGDLPAANAKESDVTVVVRNEEIARLAYELWEKGGRVHGDDWKFWLEAERILCAKAAEGAARGRM